MNRNPLKTAQDVLGPLLTAVGLPKRCNGLHCSATGHFDGRLHD